MRRKIEKYLARTQGVEEGKAQTLEDGRFDFMGNLNGVLAAVRGKDGSGRSKRKSNSKSKASNPKNTKGSKSKDIPPTNKQPSSSSSDNKENNGMKPKHPPVQYRSERRFGDEYSLSPQRRSKNPMPSQKQHFCSKLINDISLLSPGFMLASSPNPSNFGNGKSKHKLQSPSVQRGLGDIFSPDLNINGMTPLSVSRDNLAKTGFNIFSPDLDINRNLFSCSKACPDETSKTMLEVSVSPILRSPQNVPESKRRKYFTDESLEGPVESFEKTTAPANISLSRDDSVCLGVVPLKAVTPGYKDPVVCGISFESACEESSDKRTNHALCTPDNPVLSSEDDTGSKRKVGEI